MKSGPILDLFASRLSFMLHSDLAIGRNMASKHFLFLMWNKKLFINQKLEILCADADYVSGHFLSIGAGCGMYEANTTFVLIKLEYNSWQLLQLYTLPVKLLACI